MKKTIVLLLVVFGMQSIYAQKTPATYLDSSDVAIKRAKMWLKAFDAGNINTMHQLSAEGTDMCHLKYLVDIHLSEDSMFQWGKATWFEFKKDTAYGIIGFSINASFDLRPGETKQTAPNLPLFLHTNSKGKWIVNIYFSNFDFIECDCEEEEEELPKINKNDY